MTEFSDNTGLVAALSGGTGVTITALATAWTRSRKVDKVDAVKAISQAYDRVIQRLEAQVDSLDSQVGELRAEMRRRDELFERLLEKAITAPPVVAVAPIPAEVVRQVRKSDTEGDA